MIESEWLGCADPLAMLRHLGCKANDRKRRLFACGCCRRAWHLLVDPRIRTAVEIAERYADKAANEAELENANDCAEVVFRSRNLTPGAYAAAHAVVSTTAGRLDPLQTALLAAQAIVNPRNTAEPTKAERASFEAERAAQSCVLRDIVGNPFHPVAVEDSWLRWHNGTVPKLAQAMYERRVFDRVPTLADALEKAGCAQSDILEHCRSRSEHMRGCWVVDLVLGRD
jgi:hypothetical protein